MGKPVEASVVIKRPRVEVFKFVTDLDSAPQWQAELVEVRDVSQTPIGAGATMTVVRLHLGRRVENTMRVSAYEPPGRISLVTVSGYLPADLDFFLEAVNGGTRVIVRNDWQLPDGLFFRLLRLAKGLFDRMDQRQWMSNLEKLRALLETRAVKSG